MSTTILRSTSSYPKTPMIVHNIHEQKKLSKSDEGERGCRIPCKSATGNSLFSHVKNYRKIRNLCLFLSLPFPQRYIKRVDPHLNNSCLDETRSAYDSHMDIYCQKYHVNYSCQASSDLLCHTFTFNLLFQLTLGKSTRISR